MIELTNYISKLFYKNNSYCILTYVDIDEVWSSEKIINFMNEIVEKSSILKQTIIEKDKLYFLDEVKSFVLANYYTIEYAKQEEFDNYIPNLLNKDFETDAKWTFFWCVDKEAKKTRYYFKIHHAYTDGYKVIELLSSPEKEKNDVTKNFKRSACGGWLNKIYHFFIGSFILILMNMQVFFNILLYKNTDENSDKNNTDFIICKALKLADIKTFTKTKKFTVNDFLYAVMIKTDRLYRKEDHNVTTCSTINISGKNQTNNMCPIFNQINNSDNHSTLLNKINSTFNHYKYSLYIPALSFILNKVTPYISLNIISFVYNKLNNVDYVFSNIITPIIKEYKIEDIHFILNNKNKEIVYNIISGGNNVNIICSFKEGIIADKARFEQCIYEAYDSLILTTE